MDATLNIDTAVHVSHLVGFFEYCLFSVHSSIPDLSMYSYAFLHVDAHKGPLEALMSSL